MFSYNWIHSSLKLIRKLWKWIFHYTDPKCSILVLLSLYTVEGKRIAYEMGKFAARMDIEEIPIVIRYVLGTMGLLSAWIFPYISILISTLTILIVLFSSEKIWKKLLLIFLLSPPWFISYGYCMRDILPH